MLPDERVEVEGVSLGLKGGATLLTGLVSVSLTSGSIPVDEQELSSTRVSQSPCFEQVAAVIFNYPSDVTA